MPAEFSRTQRLGEQIKRDLALLIQRELRILVWYGHS